MKIFLLVVFLFLSDFVFAQKTEVGLRAGLNFSRLSTTENPDPFKLSTGFNGGFFIQVPVNDKFAVQPELYYSVQGTTIKDDNSIKLNLHYINVPVLFQFLAARNLRIETGPEAGLLLSARGKTGSASGDVGFRYNDFNIAWVLGMRYLIDKSIGLYTRYNMGLNNIYALDGLELKNRVLQLGIFVPF